jgi:AcrR family transcriptional regulator
MVYRRTPRSERAREASREAILAAAESIMRRHGYAATTMQDIVAEAGTSIGNAYFYFRNKDELLGIVMRRVIDDRWAATLSLGARAPAGAERIATVIYANITGMLVIERQFAISIAETVERIAYLKQSSLSHWPVLLEDCCPHLSEDERMLAAASIWGANRTLGELVLAGAISAEPHALASFAVRWSLRALKVAEQEIEVAVASARRRVENEVLQGG